MTKLKQSKHINQPPPAWRVPGWNNLKRSNNMTQTTTTAQTKEAVINEKDD
jgi:hypothetical protein